MAGDGADSINAIGNHEYTTFVHVGVAEQFRSQFQRVTGIASKYWHHAWIKGAQQIFYGGHIVGEWYNSMCIPGVGNEGSQAFLALPQNVSNFLPCSDDSRGLNIFCPHGQ